MRCARQGMPQLETLYHELGHALNSVLSRTQYQHASGEWWQISDINGGVLTKFLSYRLF